MWWVGVCVEGCVSEVCVRCVWEGVYVKAVCVCVGGCV